MGTPKRSQIGSCLATEVKASLAHAFSPSDIPVPPDISP